MNVIITAVNINVMHILLKAFQKSAHTGRLKLRSGIVLVDRIYTDRILPVIIPIHYISVDRYTKLSIYANYIINRIL